MLNLKPHIKIAIIYLFILSLIGVLLRLFMVSPLGFNYKFVLHGHSHIAMLGWVYTGLTTLIYHLYLSKKNIEKQYKRLFLFTQMTIVGMLITFPITGYALFSIIFSSLFIFASYGFIRLFFTYTSPEEKRTYAYKCFRIALWYMALSSIGPWALGGIMNTLGNTSPWYKNAIYFYLHFQYNGWFIMALLGAFFKVLEERKVNPSTTVFEQFFWLFNGGVILTFLLSILWMKPHISFYILSGLGAIMQIIALGILIRAILPFSQDFLRNVSPNFLWALKVITTFFIIKLVIQFFGAFPIIVDTISFNRDVIIGYLHWIFLGIVSMGLFAFLGKFSLMKFSMRAYYFYLIGLLSMEGILFYRGIAGWLGLPMIQALPMLLLLSSILILLVVVFVFIEQIQLIKRLW